MSSAENNVLSLVKPEEKVIELPPYDDKKDVEMQDAPSVVSIKKEEPKVESSPSSSDKEKEEKKPEPFLIDMKQLKKEHYNKVKKDKNTFKRKHDKPVVDRKNNIQHTVHVGNVNYETTNTQLYHFFRNKCGSDIIRASICKNKQGSSAGFAFVDFKSFLACQLALTLDGKIHNKRPLKVTMKRKQN